MNKGKKKNIEPYVHNRVKDKLRGKSKGKSERVRFKMRPKKRQDGKSLRWKDTEIEKLHIQSLTG